MQTIQNTLSQIEIVPLYTIRSRWWWYSVELICRKYKVPGAPQNAGKGMSKCRSLISFFFQVCLVFLFGSEDNGNNDAISSFISSLNLNKC